MIIPVRCFTCGKVLGDKWNYYKKKCEDKRNKMKNDVAKDDEKDETVDTDKNDLAFYEKWGYGEILDELGLTRLCCRRHMLGHVELINII